MPQAARSLLDLLSDPATWIHRRVETFDYTTGDVTRTRVSVDFTMPQELLKLGAVPLGLVSKRVLSGLDVTDAAGKSLSVLNSSQNAELACKLLVEASGGTLAAHTVLMNCVVLYQPTDGDEETRRKQLEELEQVMANSPVQVADRTGRWAELLQQGFLFAVAVPPGLVAGERVIIKYTYTVSMRSDRWLTHEVFQPVETNWSATTHVEVRAPASTAVNDMYPCILVPKAESGEVEIVPVDGREDRHARPRSGHIVVKAPEEPTDIHTAYELVAQRGGIVFAALLASALTAVLLAGVSVAHWLGHGLLGQPSDGSASAILLVGPAILLALLSQRPEHPVVRRILRVARGALLADAGLLFLAAAVAAGVFVPSWAWLAWHACTVAALGLAAMYGLWFAKKSV